MATQLEELTRPVQTRQRSRSWRWDVVQALHEKNSALTDADLAAVTGGDVESIRRAVEGLAVGGVVCVEYISGDPRITMVCRLAAI